MIGRGAVAVASGLTLMLAQSCASAPSPAQGVANGGETAAYPGPCPPGAMVVETMPSTGRFTSPDGRGTWTNEVVAEYRPGDRTAETDVKTRVRHEQADDMTSRVDRRREVVCGSESEPMAGERTQPELAPSPAPAPETPRPPALRIDDAASAP